KVSNTIASTLAIKPGLVVVMSALFGAITWNLLTWYRGLPSSSTHALIGGLCGAGVAAAGGLGGVQWSALVKQVASLVISPPIGFGTYAGGWRIIRTLGWSIFKLEPATGFSAQLMGASVIQGATLIGLPVSTTHVVTGSVLGVGASRNLGAVRWGVGANIVAAW